MNRVGLGDWVRRVAGMVADVCWPPACVVCGTWVGRASVVVCPRCEGGIRRHGVVCATCGSGLGSGQPSSLPGGRPGGRCASCRRQEPHFTRARSVGPHLPPLSTMIYHLKYRRRPLLATPLAAHLAQVMEACELAQWDALVPVPTTAWRRWRRGYNQAQVLAEAVGRLTGQPVLSHAVKRRGGPSQVGAGSAERARNVRGRFWVVDGRAVRHQRIVVVDDVLTTGATANEMARVLMAAGARAVSVVTLTSTGQASGT